MFGVSRGIGIGLRRRSPVEIATLAEKDDFEQQLDAISVPPLPPTDFREEKWSDGKEFNRGQFDTEAYKQYLKKFTSK